MKGLVFAIERCSLNDGPGIRTTVFLKGCPLHCLWCHNPESISRRPELYFLHERCVKCGACVEVCPHQCHSLVDGEHRIDRTNCEACGLCVDACAVGALEIKGRLMEVGEVMAVVEKDRAYYDSSGGGVTISGGEPMAQFAFTSALLQAAREGGVHTCLETSGQAATRAYLDLVPVVDLFLFDWKESDSNLHKQFTGSGNELIRQNLLALDEAGAAVILRCPMVPGCNSRPGHLAGIAEIANRLRHLRAIEIMPYHPMGQSKSERLGKTYPLGETDFVNQATAEDWREAIRRQTSVSVS